MSTSGNGAQGYAGPYQWKGNFYTVQTTVTGGCGVLKSATISGTMTEQDTTNRPVASAGNQVQFSSAQSRSGNLILIVTTTEEEAVFAAFDMDSDTYSSASGGVLIESFAAADSSGVGHTAGIVERSTGDLIAIHLDVNANMGVNYLRVFFAVSTDGGAVWGASTELSDGVKNEIHYRRGSATIFSDGTNDDFTHVVWSGDDSGALDVMWRSINSSDTLGTLTDTTFNGQSTQRGVAFDRAGTGKIRFPFEDTDGNDVRVLGFDHGSTPGSGDAQDVFTSAGIRLISRTPQVALTVVGDVVHIYWTDDSDLDLWESDDQGSDTWATRDNVVVGSIGGIAGCNYLDDPDTGDSVVALLWQNNTQSDSDNGDATTINPTTGNLTDLNMELVNSRTPPFDIGGDFYFIGAGFGDSHLVCARATAATPADADWDSIDNPIPMPPGGPLKSVWAEEVGSDLHVGTMQESGLITYSIFDPGTNAFTLRAEPVTWIDEHANYTDLPPAGDDAYSVTLGLRGDGDVVIGFCVAAGAGTPVLSAIVRVSGTWGAVLTNGQGGAGHRGCVAIGPDGSDRFVLVGTDTTASLAVGIVLLSNDTFGSEFTLELSTDTALQVAGPGVNAGGEYFAPFCDNANDVGVAHDTEADSPGAPTVDENVSDNDVNRDGATAKPFPGGNMALVETGGQVFLVYSRQSTRDIYMDADIINGGETDTLEATKNATTLSANVDAAGDAILVMYNESGVGTEFLSIDISVAPGELSLRRPPLRQSLVHR